MIPYYMVYNMVSYNMVLLYQIIILLATLIYVLLLNQNFKQLHYNKLLLAFMQFPSKICFNKPSPDIGPIIEYIC